MGRLWSAPFRYLDGVEGMMRICRSIPLVLSIVGGAARADEPGPVDPWAAQLISAVREHYQAPETPDCHARVTARVTAAGVLLTLDLPTGQRTEQCDEALLGAFRGVEIGVPPESLLVDGIATVVVPLGETPIAVNPGAS